MKVLVLRYNSETVLAGMAPEGAVRSTEQSDIGNVDDPHIGVANPSRDALRKILVEQKPFSRVSQPGC